VQVLEDREGVAAKHFGDDAPIKGRSINEGEAANERISNDSKDVARVLTSMDAATVLAGGIDVPTGSDFIPTVGPPATIISTGSEVSPTASPIVGPTASLIVTSYSRRKGKEVMVEIVPLFDTMLEHQGEGSSTPTEPHHTPSPRADTSHPTTSLIPLPSIPTAPIPLVTQPDTTPIRQYSRRARIAQSFALPT
nr:hypothetical protein [Tanacetum cinerariifolium]